MYKYDSLFLQYLASLPYLMAHSYLFFLRNVYKCVAPKNTELKEVERMAPEDWKAVHVCNNRLKKDLSEMKKIDNNYLLQVIGW